MLKPVKTFAIIALSPVALIALAAVFGGWITLLALAYITMVAFALDEGVSRLAPTADADGDFTKANQLSVILAVAHFILLALVVLALSGGTGLGAAERVALFFSAGLFFGQVSNSNAHELIHRTDKRLFTLGKWVYISLLFGHHTSAHPKIHHRYVASPEDPNSAREGETFYQFFPRAWIGAFKAGYEVEKADRMRGSGKRLHPYVTYLAGGAAMLILAFGIGGAGGVMAFVFVAFYAQVQLMLSDYVQHYGLQRGHVSAGKLEPVGPQHSWNAPHWFTTHLMLNAPRHSDHHAHPARPYPALRLPDATQAPMLPYSLPAMATLALMPSLWQRVMGRRLEKWYAAHPRPTPAL
ncbi:alkane 1-monooxygenase [Aliiroseovarius subalbicans]|uniref:alkane 1-monooxygenase n=1 Tax=Aliiroseovarius subalbicans TaxID=2925840 RepID=UPI001F575CA4|nr:alkane 1-monooxygenase [Aliiroseovarius subalbicans]MCI2399333.1 alkane 1-monooxygenase [Aliiroseovarius subalbicans]